MKGRKKRARTAGDQCTGSIIANSTRLLILDRNGIPFLGRHYVSEMRKGCNSWRCPPLVKVTSSNREERTGAALEKYLDSMPPVK